jgi:CBS domain-containing protein
MKTKEILRVKGRSVLHSISPDGLLSAALGVMVEQDIGSLVVMEGSKLAGMLTFREVLRAVHANQGAAGGLRVKAVMTAPRAIGPDAEIDDLRRVMLETHTRYMPVVEGDSVIGVLSFHDVAKAVLEEQAFENKMLKGYISDAVA